MADFSSISNEALRTLVSGSPALATLDDAQLTEMITRFAVAGPEQQVAYVEIFQQEQAMRLDLERRQAQEISDASTKVDQAMSELQKAQREYDTATRQLAESQNLAQDEQHANDLLKQLESI